MSGQYQGLPMLQIVYQLPSPLSLSCKTTDWWENVVLLTFTDYDWLQNFRMRKVACDYLCTQLQPLIQRRDTHLRCAITCQASSCHNTVVLGYPSWSWVLYDCSPLWYQQIYSMWNCTWNCMCYSDKQYIKFPIGHGQQNVIHGFESMWDFPQCVEAIDGSHIPERLPALNHTDYYNSKGWYSILVQAVIMNTYYAISMWNGRAVCTMHVFLEILPFLKMLLQSRFYMVTTIQCIRCEIPPLLIADLSYPLLPWLLKPYANHGSLTPEQKNFNYGLSCARIVSENAFKG